MLFDYMVHIWNIKSALRLEMCIVICEVNMSWKWSSLSWQIMTPRWINLSIVDCGWIDYLNQFAVVPLNSPRKCDWLLTIVQILGMKKLSMTTITETIQKWQSSSGEWYVRTQSKHSKNWCDATDVVSRLATLYVQRLAIQPKPPVRDHPKCEDLVALVQDIKKWSWPVMWWSFTRGSNYSALAGKILVFWIGSHLWKVLAHGLLTILGITVFESGTQCVSSKHKNELVDPRNLTVASPEILGSRETPSSTL